MHFNEIRQRTHVVSWRKTTTGKAVLLSSAPCALLLLFLLIGEVEHSVRRRWVKRFSFRRHHALLLFIGEVKKTLMH